MIINRSLTFPFVDMTWIEMVYYVGCPVSIIEIFTMFRMKQSYEEFICENSNCFFFSKIVIFIMLCFYCVLLFYFAVF